MYLGPALQRPPRRVFVWDTNLGNRSMHGPAGRLSRRWVLETSAPLAVHLCATLSPYDSPSVVWDPYLFSALSPTPTTVSWVTPRCTSLNVPCIARPRTCPPDRCTALRCPAGNAPWAALLPHTLSSSETHIVAYAASLHSLYPVYYAAQHHFPYRFRGRPQRALASISVLTTLKRHSCLVECPVRLPHKLSVSLCGVRCAP